MAYWIVSGVLLFVFLVGWGMCWSSGEADDQAQDDIIELMRLRQQNEKSL